MGRKVDWKHLVCIQVTISWILGRIALIPITFTLRKYTVLVIIHSSIVIENI